MKFTQRSFRRYVRVKHCFGNCKVFWGVGVDALFSFFNAIHQIRRGLVVSVVHEIF